MNDLKRLFEEAGFSDVVTYIQSGNALFCDSEKDRAEVRSRITQKLFEELGADIGVALLTLPEMREVVEERPADFGERADEYRYYVIFLIDPLGPVDAAEEIETREGVDKLICGKRVLYHSTELARITKSRISRIAGSPVYKSLSIRNWNTTRKLYELMEKHQTD
jgi:uncharacterized protein (DUF1697 family)